MSNEAPGWIVKKVQFARNIWGVGGGDWHISVTMNDRPAFDPEAAGAVTVDLTYLNAGIEFSREAEEEEDEQWLAYALHEVGHIALEEIRDVTRKAIARLPAREQVLFSELMAEAHERFLQRASRGITSCVSTCKVEDDDDSSQLAE